MATRVTDRFGNVVTYTYDAASPWMLNKIEANDGRRITISYGNVLGARRVNSVNDGTRTWTYGYSAQGDLSSVTLPDASRWLFSLRGLVFPYLNQLGEAAHCGFAGLWPGDELIGSLTHPSGAVGEFRTNYKTHGRTAVPRFCIQKARCFGGGGGDTALSGRMRLILNAERQTTTTALNSKGKASLTEVAGCTVATSYARWPHETVSQTLATKQLSGPGLPAMKWVYNYQQQAGSWAPCTGCAGTKSVEVTDPRGVVTRHVFGNTFRVNDGQLLLVQEGWNGSSALRTTQNRYAASGPWPEPAGLSAAEHTDYFATRHRPETSGSSSKTA